MEEPISLRQAGLFMLSNPALLALCGTAYGLIIAYAYNVGYWTGLDVSISVFPIQFWTISDLVGVSIWAASPAILIAATVFWGAQRAIGRGAMHAGRTEILILIMAAATAVGLTAEELIGHNRGWGWVAFTPAICIFIAWFITFRFLGRSRFSVSASNGEVWPGLIVFAAILTVTLAYGFGSVRAARLLRGTIYVEVGPSEKILDQAGIKTDSKEPLKLLGRTSTGCLVLAPDKKSIIFVAADVQKVLWFRQHDKTVVPEQ